MDEKEKDLEIIELIFGKSATEGSIESSQDGKPRDNRDIKLSSSFGGGNLQDLMEYAKGLGITTAGQLQEVLANKPSNITAWDYLAQQFNRKIPALSPSSYVDFVEKLLSKLQNIQGYTVSIDIKLAKDALNELYLIDSLIRDELWKTGEIVKGIKINLRPITGTKGDLATALERIYIALRELLLTNNSQSYVKPNFFYIFAGDQFIEGGLLTDREHILESLDLLLSTIDYNKGNK